MKPISVVLGLLLSVYTFAQDAFVLSGYVTADESGECLIGATIYNESNWAVTNEFGFFSIKLQKGEQFVKCSYVGRKEQSLQVNIVKDTSVVFSLQAIEFLDDVVVVAEGRQRNIGVEMGTLDIPAKLIEDMPTLLGEPDLFKSMQKLPGVQSGMEGFSGIYVRGGGTDENLILLDGALIYNSSHLMGLLSSFTPEAIKQVKLYKSFFPAKYGGRTSSVIDVRTKEGNAWQAHGTVSVGLLDDRVYIEGPLIQDKTTFSVSARGMNTFAIWPVVKLLKSPYFLSFYDLTGKFTHRFKNSDRLYFSVYHGQDKFDYSKSSSSEFTYTDELNRSDTGLKIIDENYNIHWGNTTANLRWTHNFREKLFADLSLSWSKYKMIEETFQEDMSYTDEQSGYTSKSSNSSGISDMQLSWNLEMTYFRNHSLNFGLSNIIHSFVPQKSISQQLVDSGEKKEKNLAYNNENNISFIGSESSIYIEDDFKIGEKFAANVGMRGTIFFTQGKFYSSLEPRIALEYSMLPSLLLRASYSKMSQYVHLLASGNMSLPTDLWVPITKDISPVLSSQYSIGVDYYAPKSWMFSIEAYYKREQNVLEYKDSQLAFTTSVDWEQTVEMGEGESKGIELLVQKQAGKFTGMASYTLSKTDRIFPNGTINSGKSFPFTYDRRSVIDFYANYKFNNRISVNGAWSFASGNMVTTSWRSTAILDSKGHVSLAPHISGRNNFRLSPSHRLDLGVNFKKEKRRGYRTWTFGVYNVYCAMNPNWVVNDTDLLMDNNGNMEGVYHYLSKRTFLPILPSFSYKFVF